LDELRVIDHREAMALASTGADRMLAVVDGLDERDWTRPTNCAGWDVKALLSHVLGAMEGNRRLRTFMRQYLVANRVAEWARTHAQPFTLVLDGPAGATFVHGQQGVRLQRLHWMRSSSVVPYRAAPRGPISSIRRFRSNVHHRRRNRRRHLSVMCGLTNPNVDS